jgi:Domain of unknown function(DUF2779)
MRSPLPTVIGTRPFEQVPFQWSVHVEHSSDDVRHAEYLAIEIFGDFEAMAQALMAALPSSGPIFAYNASFEERVIMRLAEWAPTHATGLRALAGRLVDLLPIMRVAYYHRDSGGPGRVAEILAWRSAQSMTGDGD